MPEHVGELELLVLLALMRLGEEAYGLSVHREIATRTRRATTFATVYSSLARLEEKGLVTSRLGEPTAERGGRRKRHYALSAAGGRAVRATLRDIQRMAQGLDLVPGAR